MTNELTDRELDAAIAERLFGWRGRCLAANVAKVYGSDSPLATVRKAI